ncbi:hypothetical protein [Streptomyces sp. ISL-86]|nr:hypothetical protein [Streptomyces sp. ISL-86]
MRTGRPPQEAWEPDPTPVEAVEEEQLAFFALEDRGLFKSA